MNKTHMQYFDKEDILHLAIADEPETGSVELSPNITNKKVVWQDNRSK